jgi:hypothetical protein
MTVDELLEHADRLEADLRHKRREIRDNNHSTYNQETLLRQCDALGNRVSEIRRQCGVLQVRTAVTAGTAVFAA